MRKKLILAMVFLLLITSMFGANIGATTNSSTFTELDYQTLKNDMLSDGYIDEETVDHLINKIKEGNPLDSFILEEKDAVSVETYIEKTGTVTVHRFADGSYTSQIIHDNNHTDLFPNQYIVPMSISGGSCSSGSGWTTCRDVLVQYKNTGVWTISFRADYTLLAGANNDRIDKVDKASVSGLLITVTSENLRIIKSREDANGPAEARLSAQIEVMGVGTLSRSVSLFVGGNTARHQYNSFL